MRIFAFNQIYLGIGEVAEWSIAAVLKTVDPQGSGGSNPSLSAINFLQIERVAERRLFVVYEGVMPYMVVWTMNWS